MDNVLSYHFPVFQNPSLLFLYQISFILNFCF
nr:MAG TPA: hypothetical protein [Caudoviricetes sp.]